MRDNFFPSEILWRMRVGTVRVVAHALGQASADDPTSMKQYPSRWLSIRKEFAPIQ